MARIVDTNDTLIKVIITLPAAKGKHTLERNNDIKIISRRWLKATKVLRVFDGKFVCNTTSLKGHADPPSLPVWITMHCGTRN